MSVPRPPISLYLVHAQCDLCPSGGQLNRNFSITVAFCVREHENWIDTLAATTHNWNSNASISMDFGPNLTGTNSMPTNSTWKLSFFFTFRRREPQTHCACANTRFWFSVHQLESSLTTSRYEYIGTSLTRTRTYSFTVVVPGNAR